MATTKKLPLARRAMVATLRFRRRAQARTARLAKVKAVPCPPWAKEPNQTKASGNPADKQERAGREEGCSAVGSTSQ